MDLINNFSLFIKEVYEIFIEMVKILDRRYKKYIWNEGQFHHSNQAIKGQLIDFNHILAIKGQLIDFNHILVLAFFIVTFNYFNVINSIKHLTI